MLVLALIYVPRSSHIQGNMHVMNENQSKCTTQSENWSHLFKAVAQMHLMFIFLHVQFRARHMNCALIPVDCGLTGLRDNKKVQMPRLQMLLDLCIKLRVLQEQVG